MDNVASVSLESHQMENTTNGYLKKKNSSRQQCRGKVEKLHNSASFGGMQLLLRGGILPSFCLHFCLSSRLLQNVSMHVSLRKVTLKEQESGL